MFTLLRGGQLFDPDDRDITDILICGETVAAIAPSIDPAGLPPPVEVHDLGGTRVVPGLVVDMHTRWRAETSERAARAIETLVERARALAGGAR